MCVTSYCTCIHELIPFHIYSCVKSFNQVYFLIMFVFNYQIITFHNFIDDDPLSAVQTDSCCSIKNISVETSAMKVLHLTLYTCMRPLEFLFACQSLLLFSVVNCQGISFNSSKSTCTRDQLLPHRGRYSTRHHSCYAGEDPISGDSAQPQPESLPQ
jgi:hypothetical protein